LATASQQLGALWHLRSLPESTKAGSKICCQLQQSCADVLIFVLKDHRGAPDLIGIVRYRCPHIDAVSGPSAQSGSVIRCVLFCTCAVFRQLALTGGAFKEA